MSAGGDDEFEVGFLHVETVVRDVLFTLDALDVGAIGPWLLALVEDQAVGRSVAANTLRVEVFPRWRHRVHAS